MKKILVSWIALANDFDNGQVNENGPTMCFHRYHWNHAFHVLLATEKDSILQGLLAERIREEFRHEVITKELSIQNVLDIREIKTKVEKILLKYREYQLEVFASPGTSAMQVAWYICLTTMNIKGRFLQTRPPGISSSGRSELFELRFKPSQKPYTMMLLEEEVTKPTSQKQFTSLRTPALEKIYNEAEPVAMADVPVLIQGETGTGKELLAQFIHKNSYRNKRDMLSVNCSAFSDDLLESRLFGYKKGAFTGAIKDTKGLFEEADGSTIFLDEIGDISPYIQKSLLRVIQEKEFLPLGATKPQKTDVRIIAATNKNLRKLCEENIFRWDLYYRLTVAELTIPSLAEQGPEAISMFLTYFMKKIAKDFGKEELEITDEAKEILLAYKWPGNIREMENLVSRLYIYCTNRIVTENLPLHVLRDKKQLVLSWQDAEKEHIRKILEMTGNSRQKAFELLGYGSYNTFLNKLRKYNLS